MALKSHATIIDDIQDLLGANSTDFTDELVTKYIEQGLNELSRYAPRFVVETFVPDAVADVANVIASKELDISRIKDLLWVSALEYPVGETPRSWRNFTQHSSNLLSMEIDFFPADSESGYTLGAALTADGTSVTFSSDPTSDDPDDFQVGDIIRIEDSQELLYITAISTTTGTVVREYLNSSATTHASGKIIYKPDIAHLYCAKTHEVSSISDLAGAVTAAYTAGIRTINVESLSTTGTVVAGMTFRITGDNTDTQYTAIKDTVLSSGAGDITFTPGLAESVADEAVVTFDNSTLTPALETLLIELVTARAGLSVAKKFIQTIPKSGRDPHRDYRKDALEDYAIVLRKLEEEARHYQQEYTIHPRS